MGTNNFIIVLVTVLVTALFCSAWWWMIILYYRKEYATTNKKKIEGKLGKLALECQKMGEIEYFQAINMILQAFNAPKEDSPVTFEGFRQKELAENSK